jgi:MinD-like ATPase involved in chromosome partitioning or flagellar assembly
MHISPDDELMSPDPSDDEQEFGIKEDPEAQSDTDGQAEGAGTGDPGGGSDSDDPEQGLVVHPWPITVFGGNTDRAPTRGWRKTLYETNIPFVHGVNVGPTNREIIEVERARCINFRERLRKVPGAVCVGFFSQRGGDGKTTLSTGTEIMSYEMNPVSEKAILIDVNTSMTTLDVVNGINKEYFLTGHYWTMETLYAFIMEQSGDIDDFNLINAKLAYRSDPQLPVIPLQLKPSARGTGNSKKSKFTGEQYLVVLRVLKKFFTLIIHDFGTEDDSELTRTAFSQLHMRAILAHTGLATTQMVGYSLEMLYLDFKELLGNTVIIFNLSSQPSEEALRAIRLEKAGKKPKFGWLRSLWRLLKGKPKATKVADGKDKEIRTPGEALAVINERLAMGKLIRHGLDPYEIVMIGFDDHLKPENKIYFSEVSDAVKANFWTAWARMLEFRVEFEQGVIEQLPEKLPAGFLLRRMDRMVLEVPSKQELEAWRTLKALPVPTELPEGSEEQAEEPSIPEWIKPEWLFLGVLPDEIDVRVRPKKPHEAELQHAAL